MVTVTEPVIIECNAPSLTPAQKPVIPLQVFALLDGTKKSGYYKVSTAVVVIGPYHTISYHTIPYQTKPYQTIPYQPCSAWWSLMTGNFNGNFKQIDCATSLYCGGT